MLNPKQNQLKGLSLYIINIRVADIFMSRQTWKMEEAYSKVPSPPREMMKSTLSVRSSSPKTLKKTSSVKRKYFHLPFYRVFNLIEGHLLWSKLEGPQLYYTKISRD